MIKITELSHKIISEKSNIKLAVDMTVGRGNDTLFLAKNAETVIGFDIQPESIVLTNNLLHSQNISNVKLINDSHENILEYIKDPVDVAIYNLGYLPKGNKEIKTEKNSTIKSLKSLLSILSIHGLVVIVIYPHNQDEINAILDLVSELKDYFDVMKYQVLNKENCPFIISIEKR
ncbi:MAG: class I SAM-dependent methyltransferase [Candidatus Izemoplasmatales bacterium]|nr:class I SAM-dependent methyltransferase [Candidatus Izemoplasmatales bacterium]